MSKIAVVGLGLIGGSLALALRARGYDRSPEIRARARQKGIDTPEALADAVADADLVVVAAPTRETAVLLREVASLAPGVILTDTASLKKPMVDAARTLRAGVRFVSGHPMAGSHRHGVEAATAELFRHRPWILVATARSDPPALDAVSELVRTVGARPVLLNAETHDHLMTWASHLPHAVAAALTRAIDAEVGARIAEVAGPGFLGTTRVASQPLALSLELMLADPRALADAIEAMSVELATLSSALRREDVNAIAGFLEKAGVFRRAIESDD